MAFSLVQTKRSTLDVRTGCPPYCASTSAGPASLPPYFLLSRMCSWGSYVPNIRLNDLVFECGPRPSVRTDLLEGY